MMGQQTGQRSTLTVNHGTYYLDTTVGLNAQKNCPDGAAQCAVNVFKPGGTYYLFLIYAKDSTEQTYRFYVGDPGFLPSSIELVQANLHKNPVAFGPVGSGTKPSKVDWYKGDKTTGVIEVVIKSADIPDWAAQIATVKKNTCQPSSYCHYDEAAGCVDNSGSGAVCRWAIADQDCPDKGCIGIKFKLPDTFKTDPPNQVRPPAVCVPKAAPWDVSLDAIKVPSGVCPLPADVLAADFCPAK